MPLLVEVAFKGNRKEFFHWNEDSALPLRAPVIVEADRGEDLGYVYAMGELAEKRIAGVSHRPEEPVSLTVRRRASSEEVHRLEELRAEDEDARRQAAERVRAAALQMKVSDAEWRWDRRKLTFYFTAEKRVDFRNLVRDLAAQFRTRIELKQIGVRDEAKRLSGIGRCGREYCSASWLPDLRPVNLGVARDQRLSLNPTQISGACGRLMCCLRYEHDFYVQQRKRFPKEGKILETSKGEEKVLYNDIFRERVTLRSAEGDVRIVPLGEFRREWKQAPASDHALDEETPPIPVEGLSDEVLRLQDTAEMPAWLPRSAPADGPAREGRSLPVRDSRPQPSRDANRREGGGAEAAPTAETPRTPRREDRRPPERTTSNKPPEAGDAPPRGSGDASPQPEDAGRGRRRRGRRGGRRNDHRSPGSGNNTPDGGSA